MGDFGATKRVAAYFAHNSLPIMLMAGVAAAQSIVLSEGRHPYYDAPSRFEHGGQTKAAVRNETKAG